MGNVFRSFITPVVALLILSAGAVAEEHAAGFWRQRIVPPIMLRGSCPHHGGGKGGHHGGYGHHGKGGTAGGMAMFERLDERVEPDRDPEAGDGQPLADVPPTFPGAPAAESG